MTGDGFSDDRGGAARRAPGESTPASPGGVLSQGLEWHGDTDLLPDDPPYASSVRLACYQPARGPRRTIGGIITTARDPRPPDTAAGRAWHQVKRAVIGRPLASEQAVHERLTKGRALAILASDALASVAYGTEATLVILVLGGAAGLATLMPITLAILALLLLVGISYRQTIPAYPGGGGSYIVARANLGTTPGLVAAAALMLDYVLNVAVSVSAGVLALVSAAPELARFTVPLCLTFLVLVALGNLRGVRESGTIFALPTYCFIVSILVLVAVGLVRVLGGDPAATGTPREALPAAGSLGLFLILRAFANGCTALTGVEAISNGIPAFQQPQARNAATTLTWVVGLLGAMFLGVSFLAARYGIVPRAGESVVSQVAEQVFGGRGLPYFLVQAATILILLLATNTSFADFPRLAAILARDGFAPRQFQFRGDRLTLTIGIVALTVAAGVLVIAFRGDTNALIPLFAIGAFMAFTLSQAGMVRHWLATPGAHRRSLLINGAGAITTGLTTLIIAVSKFRDGAWLVLLLIPLIVVFFRVVGRHYTQAAREGTLATETPLAPDAIRHTLIVPLAALNRVALQTLAYARSIAPAVTAVHVSDDRAAIAALRAEWERLGATHPFLRDVELVLIESPYRALTGPLLAYIDEVDARDPDDTLTIVLPEFVPARWWEQPLHGQTALRLKAALLFRPGTVVTSVPYHLHRGPDERDRAIGEG